ncbi:cytochrome P450 [Dactylosporangium sp. NPDC051484]|uniref:cytochrome P450 n=1 Tax=Dactylosporangium sp. NPDC051484 TaxID=3154942 RepID=UPI003450F910
MRTAPAPDVAAVDICVDFTDPAVFRDGNPHAVWHAMRERDPVHWHPPTESRVGYWSVTRYRDVEAVLRDHRTFTSEGGTLLALLGEPDPASRQQLSATDPPRHTQMRAPLQRALVGGRTDRHQDLLREHARRLLDPMRSGEPFDFAAAMHQLPVVMFGTLMDLPSSDWAWLAQRAEIAIAPDDPLYRLPAGAQATAQRAHRELFAYFQDMATARARRPGDDLLSLLLTMHVDGRPLDRGAVMANCYLLLIGSTVTVPEVPKAALLELITTGGYEAWATQPDLLGSGIEEALRWASPANHVLRYATCDTRIGEVSIRAGDAVVVWYGSANRDREIFEEPFTFDVRRHPNRHLTFGSGAHYCVGFAVARMTLRTLFEELFATFDKIELAGEVTHIASNFVAGITSLPVAARTRGAISVGERA